MSKLKKLLLASFLLLLCACGGGEEAEDTKDKDVKDDEVAEHDNDSDLALDDTDKEFIDKVTTTKKISEEEAVGKTVVNKKFVTKYNDVKEYFSHRNAKSVYTSVMFIDGAYAEGEDESSLVWHFYDDKDTYQKALDEYISNNGAFLLRVNNPTSLYFAYYVIPAIQDMDGDGIVSYDEAVQDYQDFYADRATIIE